MTDEELLDPSHRLCIQCMHATSAHNNRDWKEFLCKALENPGRVNKVNGEMVYDEPLCHMQRGIFVTHAYADNYCTTEGKWFKFNEARYGESGTVAVRLRVDSLLPSPAATSLTRTPPKSIASVDDLGL